MDVVDEAEVRATPPQRRKKRHAVADLDQEIGGAKPADVLERRTQVLRELAAG
jgi:hypothetical protein